MPHIQHFNEVSGLKLPSVSAIPAIYHKDMSGFQDWICSKIGPHQCCTQKGREYYQEAAHLGNDIHTLRDAFLRGEKFEEGVPEYQAQVFDPVARFYTETGYKPLVIEQDEYKVTGIELKMTGKEFGGSLDGVGTFTIPFWEKQRKTFWDKRSVNLDLASPTTESVWIEDLKVKSELDPLHPLQLYGYSLLLKECYDVHANWGLIIRREKKLDKRPEIQLRAYYLPAFKAEWDASMLMWKFLNQ